MLIHDYINWQKVRVLGDLQLLTRASYIFLIAIPLLAALWPGVRIVINQYNQAVSSANASLDATSVRLEAQIIQLETLRRNGEISEQQSSVVLEKYSHILDSLNRKLDNLMTNYSTKVIENPSLPSIWALGFLVSLCIFIAHTLYQMFAPDLVRAINIDNFKVKKRNEYANNPSIRFIQQATEYISDYPNTSSEKLLRSYDGLVESIEIIRHDIKMRPTEARRARAEEFKNEFPEFSSKNLNELERIKVGLEADIVSTGAHCVYFFASIENRLAIYCSAFFYVVGIAIILYIIAMQTHAVIKAAGWV